MPNVPLALLLASALSACGGASDSAGPVGDSGVVDTADTDTPAVDADADGFAADADCDDANAAVNPDAAEVCNSVDDDCDASVDEDPADGTTWYPDADGDGWGDDASAVVACAAPTGSVQQGGDCADTSAAAYPGAPLEVCDGSDNDCDDATPGETGVWHEHDGAWTDLTAEFAEGVAGDPVGVTLAPGTLHVCDGTWYVGLTGTAGTYAVVGHGTTEAPVLDAAGGASVLSVTGDGVDLTVEGLTLVGGSGTWSTIGQMGGGIHCAASGGSAVALIDSTIERGDAGAGGAISVEACDLAITRSTLRSNAADYGGAIFVYTPSVGVSVTLTDSLVEGNTGHSAGGGIDVESFAPTTLDLVGTWFADNEGSWGGGLALQGEVAASCAGSPDVTAGFHGNVSERGGGVNLYGGDHVATFHAASCDFGAAGSAADNVPEDILVWGAEVPAYAYDDDTTVACDGTGCR